MRILYMGSADISAVVLEAMLRANLGEIVGVVTQPDRPAGRHKHLTPCPCRAFALARNLHTLTPEKVNAPESLAAMAVLAPDVIVVTAYGQFLGRKLLAIPPKGCINAHVSILPKYRGAAPIHYAVLNGESETGVTIMLMDEGMDSGDILHIRRTPIRPDDTVGTLHDRVALLAGEALVEALPKWMDGALPRTPQNSAEATFAAKLKKADGIIDWSHSAASLERRIRAFNPWPSCFTTFLSKSTPHRLKVLVAKTVENSTTGGLGVITEIRDDGPVVQTGDGWLLLAQVQPDGGTPMSGRSFLNGHKLAIGDVFL